MKMRLILTSVVAVAALALIAVTYATGGGNDGGLNVAKVQALAAQPGANPAGGDASVVAQQQGNFGITVTGNGLATADADSAVLEFYFNSSGYPMYGSDTPMPVPPSTPPAGQEATPITEEALAPVIDAIVTAGAARDDIELMNVWADPYNSSGTLRVTLDNLGSVNAVRDAGQNAASSLSGIYLSSTNLLYTLSDCTALEQEALKAAVDDAGERATVFAQALGVGLGDIIGASDYGYYGGPYDGALGCGSSGGPYPIYDGYPGGQSSTVQVYANISVTYAIQ